MANKKYTVQGTITDKEGRAASGLLVQAFDDDPTTAPDQIGKAITDARGKYKIELTADQFTKPKESGGPAIVIKVFDEQNNLLHQTERHPNSGPRKTINIKLDNYLAKVKSVVQGKITDKEGQPVPGLLVQAFDDDPNTSPDQLGTVISTEAGQYKIEYTDAQFRRPKESGGPDIVIMLYDEQGKLLHETKRHPNSGRKKTINIKLENYPPEDEIKETNYIISGKAVTERGEALPGVIVEVLEQGVPGKDKAVVSVGYPVMSCDDGQYEIKIPYQDSGACHTKTPDFFIRVSDPSGKTIHSTTKFNARNREEVHLIIPKQSYAGDSEFTKLNSAIGKYLENGLQIEDIKENEEESGITYLSRKTKWDARLVAMGVLANKYASDALPADFYYTLFRAGIGSNKDSLFRMSADKAIGLYQKAIENNLVSQNGSDLAALKEAFLNESKQHILQSSSPGSTSTLDEMLSLTLTDVGDKQRFVELYFHGEEDIDKVWQSVEDSFGPEVTDQLKLDGKLGFLTFNNAPLIARLKNEQSVTSDPLDLVGSAYYREDQWQNLIDDSTAIPEVVVGETREEKRKNYVKWMAGQLRASYPTAVLAEQVQANEALKISTSADVRNEIHTILYDAQASGLEIGNFSINKHIEALEAGGNQLSKEAKLALKQLHRTYQLSPSDSAMAMLVEKGLDSAFKIINYPREDFIGRFGEDFAEGEAQFIYDKAIMDAGLVTNLTMSYLTQATNPLPAAIAPMVVNSDPASVKKYPKLEDLFGAADYCTCGHCESVLSPAAYLVDLLQFIDLTGRAHEGENPLERLFKKRPDIENLQLTCENTETVLPYIDLVNEIMEYWVIHPDTDDPGSYLEETIEGFEGYNIEEGLSSEELLASPQYVSPGAYTKLQGAIYPFDLPFSRNLALVRAYFDHLDVPLHRSMEVLRAGDELSPTAPGYGWRDTLSEYLGISPTEYAILTDHNFHRDPAGDPYPIQLYYGLEDGIVLNTVIANAKQFSKRANIKYAELIDILKTQFINPDSKLIPKLEVLQAAFNKAKADDAAIQSAFGDRGLFEIIHDFVNGDGAIDANFYQLFPTSEYDIAAYSDDLKIWMRNVHDQIMRIIFLTPTDLGVDCDFENLVLKYANPEAPELNEIEYWKLMRFIRLWRKLGWSIEQTDKAIAALYNYTAYDFSAGDLGKLDAGFKDLLIKLALVDRIRIALQIGDKGSFEKLLALFADIDTHGSSSLYRTMFLRPSILKVDDAFQEDTYGDYPADPTAKVFDHKPALQAAFNLADDAWSLIIDDLRFDAMTSLSLGNISKILRVSFLARSLKISVSELIALKALSGIDPFAAFNYDDGSGQFVEPEILKFINMANQIKQSDFKIQDLKFLLQHLDETGKSGPGDNDIFGLMKVISEGLKKINEDYPVEGALAEEAARSLLATIYGDEIAATIYAILSETRVFSTKYDHGSSELEPAITDTDARLGYDDFEEKLFYKGVMTTRKQSDLKDVTGVSPAFEGAIDRLYDQGQAEFEAFFDEHPEIREMYETHSSFEAVIDTHLASLIERLKKVTIGQTLATHLGVDASLINTLLDKELDVDSNYVLHSNRQVDIPAITDFGSLDTNGITAEYFYADRVSDSADLRVDVIVNIAFDGINMRLPANPAAGSTISAKWTFFLEAPAGGYYNFYLATDTGADVKLFMDGDEITVQNDGGSWSNRDPIELAMGQFYALEFQVTNIRDKAILKWQSKGDLIDTMPVRNLYPAVYVENYRHTYLRLLKSVRLVEGLPLSAQEVAYFSNNDDFRFGDIAFLNQIPTVAGISESTLGELFNKTMKLIHYNRLKQKLGITDDGLVSLLKMPTETDEDGNLLILKFTHWDEPELVTLIKHLTGNSASDTTTLLQLLADDRVLVERVVDAFEIIEKTGISASDMISLSTASPKPSTPVNLENAVRAKHDEATWLDVIQPINDKMRRTQRDALVSYILNALRQNEDTDHVDTPDKLFEYFLIDVEMDPCMKTSRIKQAISTVQLFIYRCLMNLEKNKDGSGVEPKSIVADQWEWMKRYRVWEANRKVFLYPENWLEPSLLDTKSPIFREFEGELLQSDINDDLARSALLNYLEKLDRIALLEICGMCRESEGKIHIIGRTAGANREYYHRSFDGAWSPWEKINLDIEDGPVIPVFWKERLFLFWTSVVQKGQDENQLPLKRDRDADYVDQSKINQPIKQRIDVNLCWSEYYNNQWQAKRTSDYEKPVSFGMTEEFSRNDLTLNNLGNAEELVIDIEHKGQGKGSFCLLNKHSIPDTQCISAFDRYLYPYTVGNSRRFTTTNSLGIEYLIGSILLGYPNPQHKILGDTFYRKIDFNHLVTDIYNDPFFCGDHRHVFFVTLSKLIKIIPPYEYIGPEIPGFVGSDIFLDDDLWIQPEVDVPGYIDPVDLPYDEIARATGIVDPPPIAEVGLTRVLKNQGVFEFEGELIGALGRNVR